MMNASRDRLWSYRLLLAVVAGCGSGTVTDGRNGECPPACPIGRHCDTTSGACVSLYGIPWAADGLANREIGYSHYDAGWPYRMVSIRFRATRTAEFDSWKQFFVFANYTQRAYCSQPPFSASHANSCYGANSGGTITMELKADDGSSSHVPAGPSLATAIITDPLNSSSAYPIYGDTAGSFRVIPASSWSASPILTAGSLYHMVFTNTYSGSDPWWNYDYVSLDSLYIATPNRQPGATDTDLALLYQDPGNDWIEDAQTPSFQVNYADGSTQGLGYVDTRVGSAKSIAGSNQARETFTVSGGDRVLSTVWVRLARASTLPSGSLTLRLETSTHTLIDQCAIDPTAVGTTHQWVSCALSSLPTIQNGLTYNLVLLAPAGAGTFIIYPLEKGSTSYGFDPSVCFGDGHADYSSDGGSTWPTVIPGWGSATAFDYQLYFEVQ